MWIVVNVAICVLTLAAYAAAAMIYMLLQAWSHPAESNSRWTDVAFVIAAMFALIGAGTGIWLTWEYAWWAGLIASASAFVIALLLHGITELARQTISL